MLEVTDIDFAEKVLNSDMPVLVDFWAPWCGPCRSLTPILEQVSEAYRGAVRVVKMDVDASSQTVQEYSVRSVPTLILFKSGNPVECLIGVHSKQKLGLMLDKYL